jgi:hypothetical protein
MPQVTLDTTSGYLAVPVGPPPGPCPGVVAGHSFMSTKPSALAPLVRLARLDHNPESAEDS